MFVGAAAGYAPGLAAGYDDAVESAVVVVAGLAAGADVVVPEGGAAVLGVIPSAFAVEMGLCV